MIDINRLFHTEKHHKTLVGIEPLRQTFHEYLGLLREVAQKVDGIFFYGHVTREEHHALLDWQKLIKKYLKEPDPIKKQVLLNTLSKTLPTPEAKNAALLETAQEGSREVFQWLLENGAESETVDAEGRSLFQVAFSNGNLEVVGFFIERGVDVNALLNGRPLMLHTIEQGNSDMFRLLLERGVDADTKVGGYSLIVHAVRLGNRAIVDLLIERGAKVESYLLSTAASFGHVDVVQRLLEVSSIAYDFNMLREAEELARSLGHAELAGHIRATIDSSGANFRSIFLPIICIGMIVAAFWEIIL